MADSVHAQCRARSARSAHDSRHCYVSVLTSSGTAPAAVPRNGLATRVMRQFLETRLAADNPLLTRPTVYNWLLKPSDCSWPRTREISTEHFLVQGCRLAGIFLHYIERPTPVEFPLLFWNHSCKYCALQVVTFFSFKKYRREHHKSNNEWWWQKARDSKT